MKPHKMVKQYEEEKHVFQLGDMQLQQKKNKRRLKTNISRKFLSSLLVNEYKGKKQSL